MPYLDKGGLVYRKIRFFFKNLRILRDTIDIIPKSLEKQNSIQKANLELATAILYKDFHNIDKEMEVNPLMWAIEDIEMRKARGAAIRSRIK